MYGRRFFGARYWGPRYFGAGGVPVPITGTLAAVDLPDNAEFSGTIAWLATLSATDAPDAAAFDGILGILGTLDAQDLPDIAEFSAAILLPPSVRHTDPSYEGENAAINVMITSHMNDAHVIEMDGDTVIARLGAGRGGAEHVTIAAFQARLAPDEASFINLPTEPYIGMLHQVTDSTVNTPGATVAGGGSYRVLAWYNGTNWTVIGV